MKQPWKDVTPTLVTIQTPGPTDMLERSACGPALWELNHQPKPWKEATFPLPLTLLKIWGAKGGASNPLSHLRKPS